MHSLASEFEQCDGTLLRRFAEGHDGEAFSAIVNRYSDMVYSTCRRIIGEEARAADAVQETFFQLARCAAQIRGSLPGWLHRVATRQAVELIRRDAARRKREATYAAEVQGGPSHWLEIESAVDEALEEVTLEARELLVLHFLQGQSTVKIAATKGVSQPTVSRNLAKALEQMRDKLRARGVLTGVITLETVLLHSRELAPEALRYALGKIALAKASFSVLSAGSAVSVPASGLAGKLGLAMLAAALATGTVYMAKRHAESERVNPPVSTLQSPANKALVNARVATSTPQPAMSSPSGSAARVVIKPMTQRPVQPPLVAGGRRAVVSGTPASLPVATNPPIPVPSGVIPQQGVAIANPPVFRRQIYPSFPGRPPALDTRAGLLNGSPIDKQWTPPNNGPDQSLGLQRVVTLGGRYWGRPVMTRNYPETRSASLYPPRPNKSVSR